MKPQFRDVFISFSYVMTLFAVVVSTAGIMLFSFGYGSGTLMNWGIPQPERFSSIAGLDAFGGFVVAPFFLRHVIKGLVRVLAFGVSGAPKAYGTKSAAACLVTLVLGVVVLVTTEMNEHPNYGVSFDELSAENTTNTFCPAARVVGSKDTNFEDDISVSRLGPERWSCLAITVQQQHISYWIAQRGLFFNFGLGILMFGTLGLAILRSREKVTVVGLEVSTMVKVLMVVLLAGDIAHAINGPYAESAERQAINAKNRPAPPSFTRTDGYIQQD